MTEFRFPTTGCRVRNAVLLAIDDVSLPLRRKVCLYLNKPVVRAQPVLTPESGHHAAIDSLAAHFYGTVLHEEGLYRMWYYPSSFVKDAPPPGDNLLQWFEDNLNMGPVGYAESDDGIAWRKPVLGQVELNGSRENNGIQLSDLPLEGVTVLRDDDDPDLSRRYKMVYNCRATSPRRFFTIRTAISADGITWKLGPDMPIDHFVEQASFYKHNGLYIINAQCASPHFLSEGGHCSGRQAVAWISPDFDHWLQECAPSLELPEPANPEQRGSNQPYDQVHPGIGAASFGNVAVGVFCRFHTLPNRDDWFGLGTTSGDLALAVSNDGVAFREPVKGSTFIDRADSPAPPPDEPGAVYETVLCQGNGILNVGEETRIYHGRWRNAQNYYAEIALATLPRDRWGALGLYPKEQAGSLWTCPVTLPEKWELSLNADGIQGMRVEIADERFGFIEEFSGEHSGRGGESGGLNCPVHWNADTSNLSGRTVRFRIHLNRGQHEEPRLYALYLK